MNQYPNQNPDTRQQQYYNQPINNPQPNPAFYSSQNNTPLNEQPSQKKKKKKKTKNLQKRHIIFLVFLLVGVALGVILYFAVNKYVKQLTVISIPGAPIIVEPVKTEITNDATYIIKKEEETTTLNASDMTSQLKKETWDGKSRITCLAMGLDYRDWVANEGAPRSDTMMLITYDPVTKEAGMLSIPRDLWVMIPDHGYGRINTAYSLGEGEKLPGINGKPGGGPGLAMRTVELFLGVDIQYYAVVDFYGFADFIDAIDKLAINVRDDIWVDPIGPGNTVHLMAGVQDLDGPTALAYVRYRYTEGGDFERAQRQQDVVYALYKQIRWQLPDLLTNRFEIVFNSIQRAIKTNVPVDDMIKLAWTATEIEPGNIKRAVIAPPDQVLYGRTQDGTQDILIPIPDKIREARDSIFASKGNGVQVTDEYSPVDRIRDEGAKVSVLNGCLDQDKINKAIAYLQDYGIQVVSLGVGTTGWNSSMTMYTGKPYTARFFQDVMGIPTQNIKLDFKPESDVDIVVNIVNSWCETLE